MFGCTDLRALEGKCRRSGPAPLQKLTTNQRQIMERLKEAHGDDLQVSACTLLALKDLQQDSSGPLQRSGSSRGVKLKSMVPEHFALDKCACNSCTGLITASPISDLQVCYQVLCMTSNSDDSYP